MSKSVWDVTKWRIRIKCAFLQFHQIGSHLQKILGAQVARTWTSELLSGETGYKGEVREKRCPSGALCSAASECFLWDGRVKKGVTATIPQLPRGHANRGRASAMAPWSLQLCYARAWFRSSKAQVALRRRISLPVSANKNGSRFCPPRCAEAAVPSLLDRFVEVLGAARGWPPAFRLLPGELSLESTSLYLARPAQRKAVHTLCKTDTWSSCRLKWTTDFGETRIREKPTAMGYRRLFEVCISLFLV